MSAARQGRGIEPPFLPACPPQPAAMTAAAAAAAAPPDGVGMLASGLETGLVAVAAAAEPVGCVEVVLSAWSVVGIAFTL